MNWIKENWFKTGLLLLGFWILFIASLHQYVEIKKHNLDVVNSVRLCANLSGAGVSACAERVNEQGI